MSLSEYIDIVTKVDTFYNNAWDKLVLFGAIIFIIVGVVFPYIMQRVIRNQQKKDIKLNVKRFRQWVINQQKKSEDEINDKVDKRFAAKVEELNEQMRKNNNNGKALSFHVMGYYLFDKGDFINSFRNLILAAGYYFLAENYDGVHRMVSSLSKSLPNLKYDDLIELQDVENISIFKLIKNLEEGKPGTLFKSDIIEVKNQINALKKKNEKPATV